RKDKVLAHRDPPCAVGHHEGLWLRHIGLRCTARFVTRRLLPLTPGSLARRFNRRAAASWLAACRHRSTKVASVDALYSLSLIAWRKPSLRMIVRRISRHSARSETVSTVICGSLWASNDVQEVGESRKEGRRQAGRCEAGS